MGKAFGSAWFGIFVCSVISVVNSHLLASRPDAAETMLYEGMTRRRSAHLRRINLAIGGILVIAGLTGGYLLTFWFLIVLLPLTCIAASWVMVFTANRVRDVHL